jgi:hypothetical protein
VQRSVKDHPQRKEKKGKTWSVAVSMKSGNEMGVQRQPPAQYPSRFHVLCPNLDRKEEHWTIIGVGLPR